MESTVADGRSGRHNSGIVRSKRVVAHREDAVHEDAEAALVSKVVEGEVVGSLQDVGDGCSSTIGLFVQVQHDANDLIAASSCSGVNLRKSNKVAPIDGSDDALAADAGVLGDTLTDLVDRIGSNCACVGNNSIVDVDVMELHLHASIGTAARDAITAIVARTAKAASITAAEPARSNAASAPTKVGNRESSSVRRHFHDTAARALELNKSAAKGVAERASRHLKKVSLPVTSNRARREASIATLIASRHTLN